MRPIAHTRVLEGLAGRERLRALIMCVLVAALTLSLPLTPARAQGAAHSDASAQSASTAPVSDDVLTMLDLTNASRARHNRKPLKLDTDLSAYAQRHAEWMAQNDSLTHTRKLSRPLRSVNWHTAGENIGYSWDLERLQRAFMKSTGHRRNILNSHFDHVAIGVYADGPQYWVTVIFYG